MPHYLPGENPFLKNLRDRYGLAVNQPTAGPATMYPEDLKTLRPSEWSAGDKRGVTAVPAPGRRPVKARYTWLCAAAVAAAGVLHDGAGRSSVHAQGAAAAGEIRVLPCAATSTC